MHTVSIKTFQKNLSKCINTIIKYNSSVLVTTKNGNVVVISEFQYNSLLETLYLTSKKKLVERIKAGEKEDIYKMSTYDPNKKE